MPEYAHRTLKSANRKDAVGPRVRPAAHVASSASDATGVADPGQPTVHAALNQAPAVQAVAQLKGTLNGARSAVQAAQWSSMLQAPIQGRGEGGVVQRLKVAGTNWSKVRSITASAAGAGGVLFISDRTNERLVVKPGVPADEEMAAAHAHAAVSDIGGFGKWKIKALGSRMATAHDVGGIRVARQRVELARGPLDARTAGLVDAVAADTTLIQEAAASGSSSMADQMIEQSPAKHILPGDQRHGSSKDKVKSDSPLKPLMKNDTNFVRSLGRVAATDLLLGNFDRIVDAANLENLLLNKDRKVIHPIDNTGGMAIARLLANGGGTAPNPAWTGHRLGAMFIAANYAGIAAEVWAIGGGVAMRSFSDELLTGFLGPAGARIYNVDASERIRVQTKLQNHLQHILIAFAEGLRSGRDELRSAGAIPAGAGVNQAARDQYAARLALI